jgi:hypothetical protein
MLHQPSVLKKFGAQLYVGDLKKWLSIIILFLIFFIYFYQLIYLKNL